MNKGEVILKKKMFAGMDAEVNRAYDALPTMPVHGPTCGMVIMAQDAGINLDGIDFPMFHEAFYRTIGKPSTITDKAGLIRRIPIEQDDVLSLPMGEFEVNLKAIKAEQKEKPAKAAKEKKPVLTWAQIIAAKKAAQ